MLLGSVTFRGTRRVSLGIPHKARAKSKSQSIADRVQADTPPRTRSDLLESDVPCRFGLHHIIVAPLLLGALIRGPKGLCWHRAYFASILTLRTPHRMHWELVGVPVCGISRIDCAYATK